MLDGSIGNSVSKAHSLGKMIIRVIFIIVVILLILNFARKLKGGADLSFRAFLNWLGTIEAFNVKLNISAWTIGGSWSGFNWLRNFFNMFGSVFGVIFFLGANLISLISFALQLISFVLLV